MNVCIICQSPIASKNPRKLCGNPACKSKFSSLTIANSLKKHGGEITRFRKSNGMHRKEVREKVSLTLRAMKWKPVIRGGNGTTPPLAQQLLACALGWEMEVPVKTGKSKTSGYPAVYKLDIANVPLMIGIEVDGNSHNATSRKNQDAKKVALLESLGWKVLRFTNGEVRADLMKCVQMVLSTISRPLEVTPTRQKE